MIAGNGIHIGNAENEFKKFYKKTQIPIITSWNASDLIEDNNKLFVAEWVCLVRDVQTTLSKPLTLIIVLGSRLSQPMIGYNANLFAPEANKILVDIDQNEIKNKGLNPSLYFNYDIKLTLEKLNKQKYPQSIIYSKWLNKLKN